MRAGDLDHALLSEVAADAAVVYVTTDEVAALDRLHHSDEATVA